MLRLPFGRNSICLSDRTIFCPPRYSQRGGWESRRRERDSQRGLGDSILAVILEILKGFLPVYLARRSGLIEWQLVPVALAPILGHATQPFLGFCGGKALAASGGAWLALIGLWVFPVYASLTVPVLLIQREHAWAAFSGTFALLYYAAFVLDATWLTVFAALNILIIGYTHRRELRHHPSLRPWLSHLLMTRKT